MTSTKIDDLRNSCECLDISENGSWSSIQSPTILTNLEPNATSSRRSSLSKAISNVTTKFLIKFPTTLSITSTEDIYFLRMIESIKSIRSHVFGLHITGVKYPTTMLEEILSIFTEPSFLPNLYELDLSYTQLSSKTIQIIRDAFNIHTSAGYCSLRRLALTRCGMGINAIALILDAMTENPYMEDLNINGNRLGNGLIPYIVKALCHRDNAWRVLSLGNNNLSLIGISMLSEHCLHLSRLDVSRNENIDDECISILFQSIWKCKSLRYLNCSSCKISSCQWFPYVNIMTSLDELDLSRNQIGDSGFVTICDSLEYCCCLRSLDLSFNQFGKNRTSLCLSHLVDAGKGLHHLNLACNRFLVDDIWPSLKTSLARNRTLLTLDFSLCALIPSQVNILCEALQENDICDLRLNGNHSLDTLLSINPRAYYHYPNLAADSSTLAMKESLPWRKALEEEITRKRELLFLQGTTLMDSHDFAKATSIHVHDMVTNTSAISMKDMERKDMYDNLEGKRAKIVDIVYGNLSENLGTIEISTSTTFSHLRDMIQPLLQKYYASCDPKSIQSLLTGFKILDLNDVVIPDDVAEVTKVWYNLNSQGIIKIYPANWISLSGPESDPDLDR